jgi:LysM repeat protein
MKYLLPNVLLCLMLFASCSTLHKSASKGELTASKSEFKSTGNVQLDYVMMYRDAARTEMERAGIPASIILGQGILESNAGQSEVAKGANNHFGVKCGSDWKGKTFYKKDDDYDTEGKLKESCFRKYESVEESFLDHGQFLHDPKKHNRYGFLFNLDRTDYKGWARGLQAAGYATSPTYANQLIELIERYKLYEYDQPGKVVQPGAPPTTETTVITNTEGGTEPAPLNSRVGRVNDVKVVISKDGETLEDIARAYRMSPDKVVAYNDRGYPPGVRLRPGTRIYIQPKKDKFSGRAAEHYVREGQTMFEISQQYGLRLDKLQEINGLQDGQEPIIGQKIILRGSRKKGDYVKIKEPVDGQQTGSTGTPNKPGNGAPPDKMTPSDELGFEMEGEGSTKPDTIRTKPGAKPPAKPGTKPTPGKPSTTGNGYPKNDNANQDPSPNRPTPDTPSAKPGYHLVVKNDTLYSLSRKYNTTVARLKKMNNMTDDNIKIGQQLKVQ